MAPSAASSPTRSTKRKTRKPRTHFRKRTSRRKNQQLVTSTSVPSKANDFTLITESSNNVELEGVIMDSNSSLEAGITSSGCSTPKGPKFRIPEILTCPPAPKKQRVSSNFTFHRSPIAFFPSPDTELFLVFSLSNVSV